MRFILFLLSLIVCSTSPVSLRVTTSVSEAVDRLSILQLKSRHLARPRAGIPNPASKLRAVQTAARDLYREVDDYLSQLDEGRGTVQRGSVRPAVAALYQRLLHVNHLLWDVEDVLRSLESTGQTSSPEFITHARLVYVLNDRRSELKREVDAVSASKHAEVKVYRPYTAGPLLVHGHLGLGDAFILNGLVRYKALFHSRVRVVVRRPYLETIAFMYRDHPGIELEVVDDEDHIQHGTQAREQWLEGWKAAGWEVLLLGYIAAPTDDWLAKRRDFAEAFYAQAGVDYDVRWSHFYVERDPLREEALYTAMVAGITGGAACVTAGGEAAYLQCADGAADAQLSVESAAQQHAVPHSIHWLNVTSSPASAGVAGLACPDTTHIAAAPRYVFLHDDPARGQLIDRTLPPVALPPELPVIHADTLTMPLTCVIGGAPPRVASAALAVRSSNLFDYGKVIAASTIFAAMDSAFALLADALLWRTLTPGALDLSVGPGFLSHPRVPAAVADPASVDVFSGQALLPLPALVEATQPAAPEQPQPASEGDAGTASLPHLILHVYARKTLYLDLYRAPFRFYDKTGRELVSARKLPTGPSRFSSFVPVGQGTNDFSRIWGDEGSGDEATAGQRAA